MAIVLIATPTIPASSSNFATKVLQKLGRIGTGETIDSGDQTIIDDAYASVYENMRTDHLVDWGSGDAVPTWAASHMVNIVANEVAANVYGLPRDVEEEEAAKRAMAKYLAVDYDHEPVEADYF